MEGVNAIDSINEAMLSISGAELKTSGELGSLLEDNEEKMVRWSIGTYARMRPPRRGHDCAKFLLGTMWIVKSCATNWS